MEPPSAYDRGGGSRPRPGRRDISELRNLARSQPELVRDENPYNQNPNRASQFRYQQQHPQQQPRRPGKRPVDQELARSVPDLNRQLSSGTDSQMTRQPSFLRATGDVSDDNESLHEVFEREKSKRDLALELEQHYPSNGAPPPYDFNNIAPPAYSPSDVSDTDYMRRKPSGGGFGPDFGDARPPPPSNSSRASGNRQPPVDRGYYNPDQEYSRGSSRGGYEASPQSRFPPRYPPAAADHQDQYFPSTPSSTEPPSSPYASSLDHHFAPPQHGDRFSTPQNAYIDEDELGDYPDGDMTLV